MTELGKIIGQQNRDTDFVKAMLGNPTAPGSGVSWYKLREETIAISIGSANIQSRSLGSSFILSHLGGRGWLGYNAGSPAAGSQPFLGTSKGVWGNLASGVDMTFTDVGVEIIRNFLGDQSPGVPTYIAIGSDGTTPTAADTALGSEFEDTRYSLVSITSGAGYIEFEAVVPSTQPAEQPTFVYEMGLFDDNATDNTGSMFGRSDFVGFWKADDIELQAIVRLNISGC